MRRLIALLALYLLWPTLCLAAMTPDKLIAQGHLQIDSHLLPAQDIVPGQRAVLELTVATDTWFTGGTRITIPEVPGLVILQTEQFAANASENRDGRTWVIQRWSIDVYPQRPGTFAIPPIRLQVNVNSAEAGDVSGEVLSPEAQLTVLLPQALEGEPDWVAAPRFEARQSFDREPQTLEVGDAITQTITVSASDMLPMMLPAVSVAQSPGLAVYSDPPTLDSDSNRGKSTATRRQTVTYVAEQPGSYQLPAMEFRWWNTRDKTLELVLLPATDLTVTGTAAAAANKVSQRQLATIAIILAIGLLVAWLGYRLLSFIPWPALKAKLQAAAQALQAGLAQLRRPALPEKLNPGSSAGD